jgi:hypothetical protein
MESSRVLSPFDDSYNLEDFHEISNGGHLNIRVRDGTSRS